MTEPIKTNFLPSINEPADLRGLSDEELQGVADEVRTYIIDRNINYTSKNVS